MIKSLWLWTAAWVAVGHVPFLVLPFFFGKTWTWSLFGVFVVASFVRRVATLRATMMRGSWRDAHVFITGGSQGLGLAMAKGAAALGAKVSIASRSATKLEAAKADILEATDGKASVFAFPVDLSKATSAEVGAVLAQATAAQGPLSVVVANAGTGHARLVTDGRDDFDEYLDGLIDLNARGTLRVVSEAAKAMEKAGGGGRICVVSSAAGLVSLPGYAYYSATKFGHRGLVAGAARELLQRNIVLSCFYPGSLLTPGYASELEDRPYVTDRIENDCSTATKADVAAKAALTAIASGDREASNELLPQLLIDAPTGFLHVDLAIALFLPLFRVSSLALYLHAKKCQIDHLRPPGTSTSRS